MQNTDDITMRLGEAQVRVPPQAAARAYLEKFMGKPATDEPFAGLAMPALPAIGEDWKGGTYAGITVHDNQPMLLICLPGEIEKSNWKDACAQAAAQDGELPSRIDALVVFKNLRDHFKKEWYWTGEQDEFLVAYAWLQDFDGGNQNFVRKSVEYRAFVVRRFPIR